MRLVVVLTVALAALGGAPANAASKECGTRTILVEDEVTRVAVNADGPVTCRVARAIATDGQFASKRGWECHSAGSEGTCTLGSRTVRYIGSRQRPRNCGRASADYPSGQGGSTTEIVDVRGISCALARRVMRRCIPTERLRGWAPDRHARPPLQTITNGSREIVFQPVAGGGAHCADV